MKNTALQQWKAFIKENGRDPKIEEWEDWGFNKNYYYQVRKMAKQAEGEKE